ncbi:MAG: BACON domain-containing carbohydrate-binding protein [Bryobacteraceae bacterium]
MPATAAALPLFCATLFVAPLAAAPVHSVWFEENQGQTTRAARFLARGPGYHFYLSPASATAVFVGETARHPRVEPRELTMELVNARSDAAMEGDEPNGDTSNYFTGNDRSRWRRGLAHYRSVVARRVWPGVDVRYYQNGRGVMEHDFVVMPGADAGAIGVRFSGAKAELLDDGALRVGEMRWERPEVYQMAGGEKRPVDGSYRIDESGVVSFALGEYDPALEITIDPEMVYARFLGGSGNDRVADMAYRPGTDEVVIAGFTNSVDVPVRNAHQATPGGRIDAFLLRTTQAGPSSYTYFGGTGDEYTASVALDAAGNAYVAGSTDSSDFPVTGLSTGNGGFVFKMAPDGTLLYSAKIRGEGFRAIAIDPAGAAYVTGPATANSFTPTPGALQTVWNGVTDVVVAKLNPAGTALVYGTYLGGAGNDVPAAIAVNAAGEAFVAGTTDSPGLATAGAFRQANQGQDGFVTRLNAAGSARIYFTYYGGAAAETMGGLALDGDAAIIGGSTSSANLPVVNAVQGTFGGDSDGFLAVLNASGSALTMSTYLGGAGSETVRDVAAAGAQTIVALGSHLFGSFPLVNPLYSNDNGAHFLTLLRASPNYAIEFSTLLPLGISATGDEAVAVALDPNDPANRMYVAGSVSSNRFPADRRGAPEAVGQVNPEAYNEGFFARFATSTGPCTPVFWADPSRDGRSVVLPPGNASIARLKVRSPHNCNWTLSATPASASWLALERSSGFGIDSVFANIPPNPGAATRSAAITISPGGESIEITQAGTDCQYTFTPPSVTLGQQGAVETVTLTTAPGCPWRYPSETTPLWFALQQTAGTPGQGPAVFSLTSVGVSSVPNEYDLSFGISGYRVRRAACGIRLQPAFLSAPGAGGTFPVLVDAQPGCAWSGASPPDWVTVVPSQGVGPTTVNVVVAPAITGGRGGQFVIAGATISVQQFETFQPASCTYRVEPGVRSYDYFGGTGRFSVVTEFGCPWRAESLEADLTAGTGSRAGPGEVGYILGFNDRSSPISRRIFVRGVNNEVVSTFTVLQRGVHPRLPQMLPMTPSGLFAQPWTFRFADGEGGADLEEMRVRLGSHRDDPNGCEFAYRRSTNLLSAGGQSASPGTPGQLSGPICLIDPQRSRVITQGNRVDLEIYINLTAIKRLAVYQSATDRAGNAWSWTPVGTAGSELTVPGKPRVLSLSPRSAGFDRETFAFTVSDDDGYADIESISVLINDALNPNRACYFGYHRPTNTVLLLNDAGTAYVDPLPLGGGGAIQNSQCRIEAAGSGDSGTSNQLTLELRILFRPGFSGSRIVHVSAQDGESTSGWVPAGFYRVQPQ